MAGHAHEQTVVTPVVLTQRVCEKGPIQRRHNKEPEECVHRATYHTFVLPVGRVILLVRGMVFIVQFRGEIQLNSESGIFGWDYFTQITLDVPLGLP